jgi:hypothetical protein
MIPENFFISAAQKNIPLAPFKGGIYFSKLFLIYPPIYSFLYSSAPLSAGYF